MKKMGKSLILVMVMAMFFGFSSQAAVNKVKITYPTRVDNAVTAWLNKSSLKVKLKVDTKVSGSTSEALKFKSDDKTVASVSSSGVVTCRQPGKAVITVSAQADRTKKDTIIFNVRQKVTTVKPGKRIINVYEGSSRTLSASYAPKNAIFDRLAFFPKDKTVAAVSRKSPTSVRVYGKRVGRTTILIKSRDRFANGKEAYAKVTVNVKPRYVSSIEPKEKNVQLGVGGTYVLDPTISPANATDKSLRFKSSDESVLTVTRSGKVTARKKGTAAVTITAADRGSRSAEVAFEVTSSVKLKSITAKPVRSTIYAGKAATYVKVSMNPSNATIKSIVFTGDNKAVATVNKRTGRVKPLAPGNVTVTCKVTDGGGRVKTAAVKISVVQRVKSIVASPSSLSLYTGDIIAATNSGSLEETLTIRFSPENASNKEVQFSSSSPSVATVDSTGKVKAVSKGTATITVTSVDGRKQDSVAVNVNSDVDTLVIADKDLVNPFTFNVNGTMTWSNPTAVRSELNRLVGDVVKKATSLGKFPASLKEFTMGYNGYTYKVAMSSSGFTFTNPAGQDVFGKMNGKPFGDVTIHFAKGASAEEVANFVSAFNAGIGMLGSNVYHFDSNLTIARKGYPTLVLSGMTIANGKMSFKANGSDAVMFTNANGEMKIINAPVLTDTLKSFFNGIIVEK